MSAHQRRQDLTDEQSVVLNKAAFVVISARQEGAAMLRESSVDLPDGWFSSPCAECACSDYAGDGGACTNNVVGPEGGSSGPCGHASSDHLGS
ncbi:MULTISPECIES: DUF6422 family protein [Streptomyces]|uniref:DUF6422 family protein n=1 Tax=Streptomyces solicathayae TaxID=3081768 RepID=A0ABZ0LWB9_9ACTN|nr:DUF6422 family protein [Streptomyces sp. HUAS YS2]WOX23717.1 DUF6422 family protein [Streptomyces sp. HUAS YS2]